MEAIELSRNNWIFIILAVMLFTFVSCTKDELETQDSFSPEIQNLDQINEQTEPTDFHR